MIDPLSIAISVLALTISALTAWLTLFRRGQIKMTQPTVIFFGSDTPSPDDKKSLPKVFFRTLMFSTSNRGQVIESMHVTLTRNETRQNFNIWVYGEDKLVRGSGLFIGQTGIAANHHFLLPKDGASFHFRNGTYTLDVYAKLLNDDGPTHLWSQQLSISSEQSKDLEEPDTGIYFDWGPDGGEYIAHIDRYNKRPIPEELLKLAARVSEQQFQDRS